MEVGELTVTEEREAAELFFSQEKQSSREERPPLLRSSRTKKRTIRCLRNLRCRCLGNLCSLDGAVRYLQSAIDDCERVAHLLLGDAERRIREERVPPHERVE